MSESQVSTRFLLESVIAHVILPPKLPAKQDKFPDRVEKALASYTLNACCTLRNSLSGDLNQLWDSVRSVVQTCANVNYGQILDRTRFLASLQTLDAGHPLIIHVAAQNAGLLVRKHYDVERGEEVAVFEAFEASPQAEQVLSSDNALQWDFLGGVVAISSATLQDPGLQNNLADFLQKASAESITRFAARASKAGSAAVEVRDTVDPSMITQMLMTLLEANGYRMTPTYLRKRVRDDVCWANGAGGQPWRRSAFWLVLRVGLVRHLTALYGAEAGRVHYKFLLCAVLAHIIADAVVDGIDHESVMLLNAKLCRRLAKLQESQNHASSNVHALHRSLFRQLGFFFEHTIQRAKQHVEDLWNKHKSSTVKQIHRLPQKSEDCDLGLTLPNSYSYLQQLLSPTRNSVNFSSNASMSRCIIPPSTPVAGSHFRKLADQYYNLAEIESQVDRHCIVPEGGSEEACIALGKRIASYLQAVQSAYDSNPEQKSIMLLTIMKLWVAMDQCAIKAFDLLGRYDPGILPTILNVLQVASEKDLLDLQRIQQYLVGRRQRCKYRGQTIFQDPREGCFAERYFHHSNDSAMMQSVFNKIETAAAEARERKHEEWQNLSTQYEQLQKELAASTCIYTDDGRQVVHDNMKCTKCYLERRAKRMKISVHEHPLPTDPFQARAVVFELNCPKAFRVYRNITWEIIGQLASPESVNSQPPRLFLHDYSELKKFMPSTPAEGVCLASTTKSFLKTHYNSIQLPVSWNDVCMHNGLKLGYYDSRTKSWTGRQRGRLSFAHHCELAVPVDSPFASLLSLPQFALDTSGPSSYEIIASQTQCPSGLSVHEFMAYQTLLSGTARRWPSILIELGSSNLNFSTEATSILISQLVLLAGPARDDDHLRSIHSILRDRSFCSKLLEEVNRRIDGISSSWREVNCMSMFLVILLRLCTVAYKVAPESLDLLEKARDITAGWVRKLRQEVRQCNEAVSSQTFSKYALWAALLCRKTFAVYADPAHAEMSLGPTALRQYIESSIVLQENLPSSISALPHMVRNALVWDMKMMYRLRYVLKAALQSSPSSLGPIIQSIWPPTEGASTPSYSEPRFLEAPDDLWVEWTMNASNEFRAQVVRFHLLEGHLLVNGQQLCKLPSKYRQSVVLQQIFGKQSLPTYPSNLPGMTYMLPFAMNDHYVHFGFTKDDLIVRAYCQGKVLEHVPPSVFRRQSTWDLPASLVDNCCHWLDLRSGILEIRPQAQLWISKPSNWKLYVRERKAIRRNSHLVDPHSALFRRVAAIFQFFELPERITVYQPERGRLSVELRRMEISFFVNGRGLLQSRQLRSEIDPNQDAGTWYGLRSLLVLRDAVNTSQRSIIVPMGTLRYARDGCHVKLNVENTDGSYGKFIINDVLGRVDCPAEPRLVYSKAMFHAYTSFVLPDPLTGTTGTEEALRFLRSGYCQPWIPLAVGPQELLTSIAKLTPRREYYPLDMRFMQRVSWDQELTTTIQHDEYISLVSSICEKSKKLSLFALDKTWSLNVDLPETPEKLRFRALWRRQQYERPNAAIETQNAAEDLKYTSRDHPKDSNARANVYEMVVLVRDWTPGVSAATNLTRAFQGFPVIAGYGLPFDRSLLSDLLSIDVGAEWGRLATLCRTSSKQDKYSLMFLFAVMSFGDFAPTDLLRSLIMFAVSERLKSLDVPPWPAYTHFESNPRPTVDYLRQLIKPFYIPYPPDERSDFPGQIAGKMRRKLEEAERKYNRQVESDCQTLAELLQRQWPCRVPTTTGLPGNLLVNVSGALERIHPEWLRLFENWQLCEHLDKVQQILDSDRIERRIRLPVFPSFELVVHPTTRYSGVPTLSRSLMKQPGPTNSNGLGLPQSLAPVDDLVAEFTVLSASESASKIEQIDMWQSTDSAEITELHAIIRNFTHSPSALERKYGEDLRESLEALKDVKLTPPTEVPLANAAALSSQIGLARRQITMRFNNLSMALEHDRTQAKWLKAGNLWPCITPVTLLEQLRSTSVTEFGAGMKESLVRYALSITALQRLLRAEEAYLKADRSRLSEELRHLGHTNWRPLDHLNWLLLEVDCNILIRSDQVDVARAMMSPASRSNSALQMNMGQGKTSCIIPMIAAELADTTQLVRVIVPKALLLQTAQLLQTRLGGLLGRDVSHIPFARKTPTTADAIKAYWQVHRDIKASSGVMVTLPEHVLSFKLSGLQRLSDKRLAEATQMVKVHQWMQRVARDILDECDFTLSARTQLIYPSGTQAAVDGHPHRWEIAQTLLHAVQGHLWNLRTDFPQSIEVVERSHGSFPMVFFLRRDVEEALLSRLVSDVLDGQLMILPTAECSPTDLGIIQDFISSDNAHPTVLKRMRNLFNDKAAARQALYLLRGLFVHRILLLTLKKRWNVQYGLHPNRDPIAVPFHSKGVPSDQAEWGHPDVAILLTCLSFYFGGLELDHLRQSLEHVLKSDDPASGYDRWTQNSGDLPDYLREWNVINVDDQVQLAELWEHFRYNVVVIDYFLNKFVFPAHAKQFRVKLQASGWDIPLFSPEGQNTRTTGFSGTNDNRVMLPLTIRQDDLPGLRHTNAEVLSYLLKRRNRNYVVAADEMGRHFTELGLLKMLCRKGIRMLIDAGAQILELDNRSLVCAWLKIDHEAPAAVYFNKENRPFVLHRGGSEVPLVASPFADDLSSCLVYLDEAHTRGTDLKMPADARGALTLGLGQTKDHTVQAAMRLRQLGTTQSIIWVAPPEVHQSILDLRSKRPGDWIDSHDVICWLLKQTCIGIEQIQPLYFSQGMDFCSRTEAAVVNKEFLTDSVQRQTYLGVLRTTEQQTLEDLYGPKGNAKSSQRYQSTVPRIGEFLRELRSRRKEFQDFGNAVNGSALQEVEQEREVAFEVEAVRQVQKPVHYSALAFPGIHDDILQFLQTGRAALRSSAWEDVHVGLRQTDLGQKFGINGTSFACKLLISKEFMRTVDLPSGRRNDNFLRPLNWLLWSTVTETALVIIPEEVEALLPILRSAQICRTHLISYAAPVTRSMLQFNSLRYFSVPPLPDAWKAPTWLTIELGILAGRLYFNFEEYEDLCSFLGVRNRKTGCGTADSDQTFTAKPLSFLQQWLSVRRRGQDFTHTPVGYICQGKTLSAEHPFFRSDAAGTLKDKVDNEISVTTRAMVEELLEASASSDTDTDGFERSRGDDDDDDYDDDDDEID